MTIRQIFCSVADLIADMETRGGDEARLLSAIREASDVLQKEIGWFVPVTQTLEMRGNGLKYLYPNPPVLALTGNVVNDDVELTTGTDFSLLERAWANGPYLGMELKAGGSVSGWCDTDPDSVEIPCHSGFYELTEACDATVGSEQSASDGTLAVSSGAGVSPGMTLLLGDEQELVTGWGSPTSSVTALNGAITATADTITVDDGSLVNVGEILRVDFEQMRVLDKRMHQCHVARGWNNTGQASHDNDAAVDVYRNVTVERAVNGTPAAIHAAGLAVNRYVTPDDIRFLTKQIATLMINKARGGYAGKHGNAETGEVYYHDAFPRYEIERIKSNYMMGHL